MSIGAELGQHTEWPKSIIKSY